MIHFYHHEITGNIREEKDTLKTSVDFLRNCSEWTESEGVGVQNDASKSRKTTPNKIFFNSKQHKVDLHFWWEYINVVQYYNQIQLECT